MGLGYVLMFAYTAFMLGNLHLIIDTAVSWSRRIFCVDPASVGASVEFRPYITYFLYMALIVFVFFAGEILISWTLPI